MGERALFSGLLGELEAVFWPDLFVIEGGVRRKHAKLIPLLSPYAPMVPVQLLDRAWMVGAALAAKGHLEAGES
jgi:polyphosphate glucokinase